MPHPSGQPPVAVDSRLPSASYPSGCLRQSPEQPPSRLGPSARPGFRFSAHPSASIPVRPAGRLGVVPIILLSMILSSMILSTSPHPLPVTRYSPRRLRRLPLPTRYQLLATRHGGCAAYLSPPVTSYSLLATAAAPPQQGHSRSE